MIWCPDRPEAVRDRLRMELHRPAPGLAKPQLSAPLALARGGGRDLHRLPPHLDHLDHLGHLGQARARLGHLGQARPGPLGSGSGSAARARPGRPPRPGRPLGLDRLDQADRLDRSTSLSTSGRPPSSTRPPRPPGQVPGADRRVQRGAGSGFPQREVNQLAAEAIVQGNSHVPALTRAMNRCGTAEPGDYWRYSRDVRHETRTRAGRRLSEGAVSAPQRPADPAPRLCTPGR